MLCLLEWLFLVFHRGNTIQQTIITTVYVYCVIFWDSHISSETCSTEG